MLNNSICSCALFLITLFYCQALPRNDVSISVDEAGDGLLKPFEDGDTITVTEKKSVYFMFQSDYPILAGRCNHNENNSSMVLSFSKDKRYISSNITTSEQTEGSWHCLFSSVASEFKKPTEPNIIVINIRVNYMLALIVLKNNDTSLIEPTTIKSKLYLKQGDSLKATCHRALVIEKLSAGSLSWSFCKLSDPEKGFGEYCDFVLPTNTSSRTSSNLITFERIFHSTMVKYELSCVYRSNYSESSVKLAVIVQPDNIEDIAPYEQVSLLSETSTDSSLYGLAVSILVDGNNVTLHPDKLLCSADISADQDQVINITAISNREMIISECHINFTYAEENNLYDHSNLSFSPTKDLRNWQANIAVSSNATGTYICSLAPNMKCRKDEAPYECIIKINQIKSKSKNIALLVGSIVAVLILLLVVASVYVLYRVKRSKPDTQLEPKLKTDERVYYTINEDYYSYVSPNYVRGSSANGIYQNDVEDDNK